MTTTEIPTTMRRLVVAKPGVDVESCTIVVQDNVPVPEPGPGQVLIRMTAAPINPSDYGTWIRANATETDPLPMGNEGCGIVVKTGSGSWIGGWTCPSVGTLVGVVGLSKDQGTYSEYVIATGTTQVFPLPKEVGETDGCSFFVNPYTAVGIFDTAVSQAGAKAMIHTAAASQLGQMMVRLSKTDTSVKLINVVRREEQAEVLRKLGAEHVVVSSTDTWKEELKAKVKDLGATVAFDAVAGSTTGDLLEVLPSNGTVYVYGGLAGKVENIDPMDLIYRKKQVRGFLLTSWIKAGGTVATLPRMMSASRKVNSGLKDGWSSTQFKDTTLEKAQDDIVALLKSKATGQKLRIVF